MFPGPAEVLAAREGTIAATPLPLLLHAIYAQGRTVTLELRLRALEKRIRFEDGSPVACRSNLLHETLGKYLVAKGRLSEDEYQEALRESVEGGRRMGELLVTKGKLAPFELYKHMQANLAHRILDAFRWADASWRLLDEAEPAELAVRVNPAQLVLTGCAGFVPFEVVASQLAFTDEQRFALAASPPHALAELKLSTKEAKLAQVLRRRPTFDEAVRESGLEVEEAMRRLYALAVLGIVEFAEGEVSTSTATATATPTPTATATPTPTSTATAGLAEESPELRDALVSEYLEHRAKDPFDLLAVRETVTAADARRAFLALADRFSPLRFSSPDLREKAEALLAARARAFAALAEADQAALWRKRRAAAAEKRAGAARPSTAEQFRISTTLLDASTQFEEGLRRLAAGDARGALDLLRFAADIEPRPTTRAHLAWARFLVDPERHARLALGELAAVAKADAGCAPAHFLAGEIHRARGAWAEAEEAYRRAQRADPSDRRAQERALEMMRARKAAR
jgi:tetratricopeptide (TPR) repeat protein